MYAAKLDTTRYTFEASGSLWRDALVMKDRQSGSLWSQISGICIDGPMKGSELKLVASEFITFGALAEKYPEALLLKKNEIGSEGSYYQGYFSSPEKFGIFGRAYDNGELRGKSIVLGVRLDRKAVAFPIEKVNKPSSALTRFMERTVVVFYDPSTGESVGFSLSNAVADEGDLKIDDNGAVTLGGQRITVNSIKSRAEGTSAFEAIPLVTSYWFAWKGFFPASEIGSFVSAE